jgi:hypothetical protein
VSTDGFMNLQVRVYGDVLGVWDIVNGRTPLAVRMKQVVKEPHGARAEYEGGCRSFKTVKI